MYFISGRKAGQVLVGPDAWPRVERCARSGDAFVLRRQARLGMVGKLRSSGDWAKHPRVAATRPEQG